MTHPIANARLRPRICPTLPPVIINEAITSVYSVIAVWIPVTVVPTSSATVAIDTFITELSNVIKNWPAANVTNTVPAPRAVTPTTPRCTTPGRYRDQPTPRANPHPQPHLTHPPNTRRL